MNCSRCKKISKCLHLICKGEELCPKCLREVYSEQVSERLERSA